jgi:hypothetical protein
LEIGTRYFPHTCLDLCHHINLFKKMMRRRGGGEKSVLYQLYSDSITSSVLYHTVGYE